MPTPAGPTTSRPSWASRTHHPSRGPDTSRPAFTASTVAGSGGPSLLPCRARRRRAQPGSPPLLVRDRADDSDRGQSVEDQLHGDRGDQEPEDLLGDQHAVLIELLAHPV